MQNPNCDNDKCKPGNYEVRKLPTGGGSNAILCQNCFNYEIAWRKERNKELSQDVAFALPKWNELEVYTGC